MASSALVAATYGLVRLAWGLHLPDMQDELRFDAGAAGAISSAASIAYCVGALAGFLLASRRARTLVLLAGATGAFGSIGMALAASTSALAPAAVLASAAAGLASPALVRIVQRGMRSSAVDRAQAVVNAGTGPGLVAAGLLALLLVPQWRLAWWAAAAVSVAAAAAVLLLDRPDAGGAEDVTGPHRANGALPPRDWFRSHRLVIAAALLAGAASAAVWNAGRALLADAGTAPQASVLAWVALGAGGLAVVPTAQLMSALAPRRAWSLSAAALTLSTLALVATPAWTPGSLAACFAFGWGYTAATGALIAWTAGVDRDRAASGTALLFVLLVLGQAIGAAAVGATVGALGYAAAFTAAAVIGATAAALGLVARVGPAVSG
ncbi:hypothetical protein GCM10025874_28010 [Arenivirga flava]|uniref:MFS transporter n=1 Tax=Arenivirga flava TaxID=1930060 RepID=A0AA37XCA6_9MICO|nr:hypothetical protein GCM10025874_28010 [Arenivirga flava]